MDINILKIQDFNKVNINKLKNYISKEKGEKINKFYKIEDKVRGLYGELLIRKMIIEKLNIKNKDIVFKSSKYGKPYLEGFENLFFNISHSGNYVICSLDYNPVGIDIEKIASINVEDIVKSSFTFKEQNYILKEYKLEERTKRFYEIWTLKESFIKCVGKGLYMPLDSFSIYVNEKNKVILEHNKNRNKYSLKRIEIDEEYKMGVCSENSNLDLKIKYISLEKINNFFMNINKII